ncbi:hypothetical protein D3C81_2053720 [compost metagenome]
MPWRAAAASPLTTVTGVEITSAHGQAITSKTSALYSQGWKGWASSKGGNTATRIASKTTMGM